MPHAPRRPDDVPTPTTNANGTTTWRLPNGHLHREDGPARTTVDGIEHWYFDDQKHREDGPASIDAQFHEWYRHGKRHREDGPAVIQLSNGKMTWYCDGKVHRDDGPAEDFPDEGIRRWYVHGRLHRLDGPAVVIKTAPYYTEVREYHVGHYRVPEQHVLDELYDAGDIDTLTLVLSTWRSFGPRPSELLAAIRAAQG